MDIGVITAGDDADVKMREAVVENGSYGGTGISVRVPSESGFANYVAFNNFFRPNGGQPAGITTPELSGREVASDVNAPEIDSTLNFGLIEAGSHVRIAALDPTAPDGDTHIINVLGTSNIIFDSAVRALRIHRGNCRRFACEQRAGQ